jgi:hypothetical protein
MIPNSDCSIHITQPRAERRQRVHDSHRTYRHSCTCCRRKPQHTTGKAPLERLVRERHDAVVETDSPQRKAMAAADGKAAFRVVKTNRRGKAQNRVLELNFTDGVISVRRRRRLAVATLSPPCRQCPLHSHAPRRQAGPRHVARCGEASSPGSSPPAPASPSRCGMLRRCLVQNLNAKGKVQKSHHASKVCWPRSRRRARVQAERRWCGRAGHVRGEGWPDHAGAAPPRQEGLQAELRCALPPTLFATAAGQYAVRYAAPY